MKKSFLAFMAIVLVISTFSVASSAFEIVLPDFEFGEETPVYDPGDVNGDGEVTIVDVSNLSRYLAGGEIEIVGNGDVSGDGEIMSNDVAALRRSLSGGQL